jgi:hypothetical protein
LTGGGGLMKQNIAVKSKKKKELRKQITRNLNNIGSADENKKKSLQ